MKHDLPDVPTSAETPAAPVSEPETRVPEPVSGQAGASESNAEPAAQGSGWGGFRKALPRTPDGRFLPDPNPSPKRSPFARPGNLVAGKRRKGGDGMHRAFYRRTALPKKYAFLRPLIEGRVAELAADHPDMTAGQRALIDLYRRAHGASLLLLAEAHEKGYIRVDAETGAWDFHPGAKEIARFAELERKVLLDLGLEREAKPLPSLDELFAAAKARAAEIQAADAQPIDVVATTKEPA